VQAGASGQSSLQGGYATGSLRYVLGLTEPAALAALRQPTACAVLVDNQGLVPGQSQASCDGRFVLRLQPNGNLVLLQGAKVLWSSRTTGKPAVQAMQRSDGNFVLNDASGKVLWSTATAGHPDAQLVVQDDGQLVIDDGPNVVWTSGTCCH